MLFRQRLAKQRLAKVLERLRELEVGERKTQKLKTERAAIPAAAPLERIQKLLELNLTELGKMFGASRQAVSSWLRRGVPALRKPKIYTVLNVVELLSRKLKRGRLPAVARREAPAYGGLTMLQMIEADRHEELLASVRESFDWSATA